MSMGQSQYRFKAGTRVLLRTGPQDWEAGEIIRLNYTEEQLQGRIMPYQVQMDDGSCRMVPADVVELCRLLVPPWWEKKVFELYPGSYFSKNPSGDVIFQAYESTHVELRDVNEADHRGETALMRAAQFNWSSGVAELLQLKADVNLVNKQKKHALHFAVPNGEAITKILIDANADLDCQEDDPDFDPEFTSTTFGDRMSHRTPLHIAALAGNAATARLLLNAGADINVPDAQYKTALHLAIEEEKMEVVELLLGHKADVSCGNMESGMKNSPLMDAAHKGNFPLVTMLLPAARGTINQQGKQEMSALHLAARKGHAKIAQLLLDSGADVTQESKCGTVEQLARKNGNSELLQVLGLVQTGGGEYTPPPPWCGALLNASSMNSAQRAELYID